MATFSQKDIQLLMLGKSSTAITTGDISTLNDGEIGVFTPGGTRLVESTATTGVDFILVQGRGSKTPIVSPVMNSTSLLSSSKKATVAAVEQVDYIGYNTVAGSSIEALSSNQYFARMNIDQSLNSNHGGLYVKHGVCQSDASATQVEIANTLVGSFINNFARETEKIAKFERVTDSTVTTATSGTLSVVNGSPYVTASIDMDNGGVVVGDYLAISGIAYKVIAINVGAAQVAQLDTPYQGATNTAIADASVGFITAANAATGAWGIKVTGKALTFNAGKIKYRKAKWDMALTGFGATTFTKSVSPNPGSGTTEQIAEMEYFMRSNDIGDLYRTAEPYTFTRIAETANVAYDLIHINFGKSSGDLVTSLRKGTITLAIPNSTPAYADGGSADDVTDVLEKLLFGSANGNFAI